LGCRHNPYLFDTFIDDIMKYIIEESTHAPIAGKQTVSGLMFADNLAIGSFTASSLQMGID
jgi:hypothetical protein